MKFLHVAQGFCTLGNRGLKWEQMGGIMGVDKSVRRGMIVNRKQALIELQSKAYKRISRVFAER